VCYEKGIYSDDRWGRLQLTVHLTVIDGDKFPKRSGAHHSCWLMRSFSFYNRNDKLDTVQGGDMYERNR